MTCRESVRDDVFSRPTGIPPRRVSFSTGSRPRLLSKALRALVLRLVLRSAMGTQQEAVLLRRAASGLVTSRQASSAGH